MVARHDRIRVRNRSTFLLAEPGIDIRPSRRRFLFAPQFPDRRYRRLATGS